MQSFAIPAEQRVAPHQLSPKRVSERDLFSFPFADYLASLPGDALSTASVTSTPAGLSIEAPVIDGDLVRVWISAGSAGTAYQLSLQGSTAYGRTFVFGTTLFVEE